MTCPGHSLARDREKIRVETPSWPLTLALPGSWVTLSVSLTANNQYSYSTFSELLVWLLQLCKQLEQGFPGGSVVKNLPAKQ